MQEDEYCYLGRSIAVKQQCVLRNIRIWKEHRNE